MPHSVPRRQVLLAGAGAFAAASSSLHAQQPVPSKRLRVAVVGGHPDDPETGAGGTMARYAVAGHEVISVYLTRGEAGIRGTSHDDAARIRTAEAEEACRILKARPLFAGQVDGATELTAARYDEFQKLFSGLLPDVVLVHFPIDTHRDHRVASMLVYDCLQRVKAKFALYYFEVLTGEQTQDFHATDYVDISAVEALKRKACFAHKSQGPGEFYSVHEKMSLFRGAECGVKHAEAFVGHASNRVAGAGLPGLS